MSYQGFLLRCRHCWLLVVLSALALSSQSALAWNAAGHRLSAVIAWSEMSPQTRQRVEDLLAVHPAREDWLRRLARGKNPIPADARALFAEASTWADDIRRDERFSDQMADVADETARHRDWHYVNWLIDGSAGGRISHISHVSRPSRSGTRGGRLDQALINQQQQLAERSNKAGARADALVWLIHLVADGHQPLHVASWRLADGSIDVGGLSFKLIDDAKPKFAESSLHTWWDDLPGPPWLRGDRLVDRATILLNVYSAAHVRQGDSNDWLQESFDLAQGPVRPSVSDPNEAWPVTVEYRGLAKKITERRLVESGVRLGRLLNALLKD